jgi:methionyl-tRNA formyltransferase
MTKDELRIVFMGTPDIATAALDAMINEGFKVVGVITAPDKPAGRGQKLQVSPVKQYALDHGLHILQPENLKEPSFNEQLRSLKPDIQVVVAFRMLPQVVWELPPLGTFNMHASLLPHYRGAAPINWAIINGETRSGVTTFFLDKEIDTGRIIAWEETSIFPEDNAGSLYDKLKIMGAGLVIKTLKLILSGKAQTIPQQELIQNPDELKKAPKLFREDCRIDWDKNVQDICNLIRGLNPLPGAFTELSLDGENDFMMKIFEANPVKTNHGFPSAKLFTDNKNYIKISANDGLVDIKMLQAAGKKRMKTQDFLRGYSFSHAEPI